MKAVLKSLSWITLSQHQAKLGQNDSVVVQARFMRLADELVANWRDPAWRVGMSAGDWPDTLAAAQDKAGRPVPCGSPPPVRSCLDHFCSDAGNEVAINWNAPPVWAALQALNPQARH